MHTKLVALLTGLLLTFLSPAILAASTNGINLNMTTSTAGLIALGIFVLSYIFVVSEEFLHVRKSKPVVFAAGFIWAMVAWTAQQLKMTEQMHQALQHNMVEYIGLFLFLLVAMTYINAMEERNIFDVLRSWLVRKGFSYRALFWIVSVIAFFLSPIADNLTTALLMGAVVIAVGKDNPRFVTVTCISIVVSANSGGAFSPFGDITTLMVWQKGLLGVQQFFKIFLPSVVSALIPALIMNFALPAGKPPAVKENQVHMKYGARRILVLFLVTISLTVAMHHYLHLPPMLGMMSGLSLLLIFSFFIKTSEKSINIEPNFTPFDIFKKIQRAEWDTLMFFYGVIFCVGGLATLGYLNILSEVMYHSWGTGLSAAHAATPANVAVGILSALIDNIPVMFAVLTMNPSMSEGQWLLVTLTAGVGGSMLSIGSAAGVALMGQARGIYTFFGHLKWVWAIALGYIAAIAVHIWINAATFSGTIN